MSRPYRARGVLGFVLVLAVGCQDYNFNPVGHCLIQPGTRRETLSNVSTADVLFVVDESGSMAGEQGDLAAGFDDFITNLNQANVDRAAGGLLPIDFHLAVTTSSVFWNYQTTSTCRTDCPGAAGTPVCCTSGSVPARQPVSCTGPGAACPVGTNTTCRLDCNRLAGEYHCCAADGTFPPEVVTDLVPCSASRVGTMCGTLETHYDFQGCASNVASDEWPFPHGDFVSKGDFVTHATAPNPRVLHFDKELYTGGGVNKQGYTSAQLVGWFKDNIQVGTCGSGQEQALQAGRLALEKAFAGQQKDTRDASGNVTWSAPTATALPGSTPARWPNPNSKLVVVFVGDEDDCSSPEDPSGGVVMLAESPSCSTPGACDACQRDALSTTAEAIRNKETAVSEFVSYFAGLSRPDRPVAAAFILPAAQEVCDINTCTTSGLCCPIGGCTQTEGAQARGIRLLGAAQGLSQAGIEVLAASICDPNFGGTGGILDRIAEIVKPPSGLELPTQPAANEVTLLRIADSSGQTRKVCSRPAPAGLTLAAAQDALDGQGNPYDWWFTADGNPGGSVALSKFVYINPKGSCIANPGETYSADYLGQLPAGGCWDDPAYAPVPGKETSGDAMCRGMLGGAIGDWTCFAGPGSGAGTCARPVAQGAPGTCICGGRSKNCQNDPLP
jgi:hypothetical protein